MKCQKCSEEISPKFVSSIKNNSCPACGGRLLSDTEHKRIFKIKSQLAGLGLDDNTMFSVAAALSEKFTLVPRDLLLTNNKKETEGESPVESEVVHSASKVSKAVVKKTNPSTNDYIDPLDSEDFDGVSEVSTDDDEEYEASVDEDEIIKEWGLDIKTNSRMAAVEDLPEEIFEEVAQINTSLTELDNSRERQMLLAKAAALKERNREKTIRRIS
jgi:DNA-directed RNA polymerase subunit RPC12/RpoP